MLPFSALAVVQPRAAEPVSFVAFLLNWRWMHARWCLLWKQAVKTQKSAKRGGCRVSAVVALQFGRQLLFLKKRTIDRT